MLEAILHALGRDHVGIWSFSLLTQTVTRYDVFDSSHVQLVTSVASLDTSLRLSGAPGIFFLLDF